MKLIIHIGTPKSGTTYIQNSLIANKDALNRDNIYYVKPKDSRIAPMAEVAYLARYDSYFWHRHTSGRQQFIRQQIFNLTRNHLFEDFISSIKQHEHSSNSVIISSENLCFLSMSSLDYLLSHFSDLDLVVLETRRPISNLIRSLYWQTSKIQQISSYGDFFRLFVTTIDLGNLLYSPFFYLTQDYLKLWRRYGTVKSINADKINLKDFLAQAGCDISNLSNLKEPKRSSSNSTPSVNFTEAVKIFWNLHPKADLSCSNNAINKSREILEDQSSVCGMNHAEIPLIPHNLFHKFIDLEQIPSKDPLFNSQLNNACNNIDCQYQSLVDLGQVSYNYNLILSNYNKIRSSLRSLVSRIVDI